MPNLLELRHTYPLGVPELFDLPESGCSPAGDPGPLSIRIEGGSTPDALVVEAELPDVDPEHDVLVTVEDDVLTLRAGRTGNSEGTRYSESRYGSFARAVRLPKGAKAGEATAEYRHGVLTVTVPITAMTGERTTIDVTHPE